MPEEMSDETLLRYLEDLLRTDKYRLRITEAGTAYPDQKSIELEFDDIDNFNRDLAEYLLNHPIKSLKIAEEAVKQVLPPDIQHPLHARVSGLPDTSNIQIRRLRGIHLGKFIAVDGLVRKITEVRPRLVEAHFMCARCGFDNVVPQDDIFVREPFECEGCRKSANQTSFRFLQDFSSYIDTQKIEIQENPEGLRGGEQPQRLAAYLEDDITGMISPGDRITINGVLMSRQKHTGRMKSTVFDIHLNINSVETKQSDYEELEITEEDVVKIEELSREPGIYEKLIRSIAPTIFSMVVEKEALSLQLFGGVRKFMPDGTKIRGDIHILLVGDPGTAKSQLLRYTSQISPRGIYTSGQASTKAGLTATAVKEEFGDGRWTLEAGALVLADKGMACLLPGTEVQLNDSWRPIEELFDPERAEEGISNGEKVEVCPVEHRVCSLPKEGNLSTIFADTNLVRRKDYSGEVLDLRFESGFRLSLTPDHKLIDGSTLQWKEAKEFQNREMVVGPFRSEPPPLENNTLTLLQGLSEAARESGNGVMVNIEGSERKRLVEALLRRKRGIGIKEKKELLSHLIPRSTGKDEHLNPKEVPEGIGEESITIPPKVMLALIKRLHQKRQYGNRPIRLVGLVGKEEYELASLPPPLFYLFGRVYTDDRRAVRETRPIRLLFQKFKRSFNEEYQGICSTSVGGLIPTSSRMLKELYYFTIRDHLAHLCALPDQCVRAFLAGVIDTNVNVSVETRKKKDKEYNTVMLKIFLPTLERESLHILGMLRRYNIYGRLIRRKHMNIIHISNDSDVNNLRELLRNFSININALPPSRPHLYEIATTYTTSNILPKKMIREIASKLLGKRNWSRSMRNQLEEFAEGRKNPVREHFNTIMSHLQDDELDDHTTELGRLLSRGYLLDRIVSIKRRQYTGPVYDLHVPGLHNFVAGGIFVHNCIDELDKMSREDSAGMHEALEQQQISIAKAGITATLQSRCSLLAAANPKFGRFDESENILAQINMLPSLLSRFDLIFPVLDRPNPKEDRDIASHILKVNIEGERLEHNKAFELEGELAGDPDDSIEPEIPVDIIRKYVAYAKRIAYPVMEKDAADYLNDYYVEFRQWNKDSRAVSITARQLEALVRLAESSARIKLSSVVTKEDAERAVKIMKYSLLRVALDAEGNIDIDRIGGVPQKKRSRLVTMRKIMEELSKGSDDGSFSPDEMIEAARKQNVGNEEVRNFIKRMLNGGELFEPVHGRYRFTR